MKCYDEQGIEVTLSQEEIDYYTKKAIELDPKVNIDNIVIQYADDKVNIHEIPKVKFERIRRITGYLSDIRTWNNGKKDELKDRIRHG